LVPFLTIAAVFEAPLLLWNVYSRSEQIPGKPPELLVTYTIVAALLSVITNYLVVGTLLFGVFKHLRHEPFTWGECLVQGLRKFPSIFGTSIVVGLAAALGFILCFVPGFYVMTVYAVAVPATVVEGKGVFASMSRSKALTTGHGWPVFGALVLAGIIVGIPALVATIALAKDPVVLIIITSAWQVFSVAFQAVLSCVIYYQLREVREDLDAPELAAAFD
jgi:hypothetical protein